MTRRVLVTGARAPVSLEVARHLHSLGCVVTLADSVRVPSSRWSRAVHRYVRVPRPVDDPRAYAEALARAAEDTGAELIVPTCEEIYYLARHRDVLPCPLLSEPFDRLVRWHDKLRFAQWVEQNVSAQHVRVPTTVALEAGSSFTDAELAERVFKPVYSRFAAFASVGPTRSEYARIARDPRAWVVQQRIRGTEYSSYSVAKDGALLAHACYHSTYRVDAGSGVLFRNVSREKTQIIAFIDAFVRASGFTGQLGFDFIEDASATYVLECNPRATSGAHLFAEDGRLGRAILGEDAGELAIADGPDRKLAFAMPLVSEITQAQVGRWASWARDAITTPDAIFRWDDLGPFLGSGLTFAEITWTALRRRRKLTEAATYDIEYDGQPI